MTATEDLPVKYPGFSLHSRWVPLDIHSVGRVDRSKQLEIFYSQGQLHPVQLQEKLMKRKKRERKNTERRCVRGINRKEKLGGGGER